MSEALHEPAAPEQPPAWLHALVATRQPGLSTSKPPLRGLRRPMAPVGAALAPGRWKQLRPATVPNSPQLAAAQLVLE